MGSNTTRLLVAEATDVGGPLRDVTAERAFTRLAAGRGPDGRLDEARVERACAEVARQAAIARAAGVPDARLRVVATAAVRAAPDGAEVCRRLGEAAGVQAELLSGEQEAGFAFEGAVRTLATPPEDATRVGVVDVGGGSTELVCGTRAEGVGWRRSFAIGSGALTERHVAGPCPSARELAALRAEAAAVLADHGAPSPQVAYAVGGSATSLFRLTAGRLHAASLQQALDRLCGGPVDDVAERLGLHPDRVRVLPAGIVILAEAARALGVELRIAAGGLREGVLLDTLARG